MKIQFDEIIEKANKRKDILLDIQDVLENNLGRILDNAHDLLGFYEHLYEDFKHLDQEGRQMLPTRVRNFLDASYHYKNNVELLLEGSNRAGHGLQGAAEEIGL